MTLSMTGYGRGETILNGRGITVEIKSVNSRYFEYFSRVPRAYTFLDDKIKKEISAVISRGKVEMNLTIQNISAGDTAVAVNHELAAAYLKAVRELAAELGLKEEVPALALARMPEVLTAVQQEQDEESLWADVRETVALALESFLTMRRAEGEKLREDILARLNTLEEDLRRVEENTEGRVAAYTARLYEKLKTLLEDRSVDESRILTEAAIFADKTAVDEETVRLHSHIQQYRDILALSEPVGRKLDFLTQELNREVNTIGSKCQDIAITRLVVEMKGEIEKIREQIQNVE
ncbi:MAG: YicC/YloC family endoribonuclease [Oscillospiraceae bacterium]|nr:YicC/YloC family endoribonuclease [Oscillospiraceae bacterium]